MGFREYAAVSLKAIQVITKLTGGQSMSDCEQIKVEGVIFELSTDSARRMHVSKDGKRLMGHVERRPDGRFGVSFIERSFADLHCAVKHLAYSYTMRQYKSPLGIESIQWSDGSVSELVSAPTDSPLQLTLWQIETQMEEARAAILKAPVIGKASQGKDRVYKAEIGLKVHRAIELILKVLLGIDGERRVWRLDSSNRKHTLTPLYEKLEQKNAQAAAGLEELFRKTVMIHGDPRYGTFRNPLGLPISDGRSDIQVTLMPCEDITVPGAQGLRDHLALMDINSTYNQAYLGDAVLEVSEAYLKYVANSGPFLDFAEAALREVVMPSVEHVFGDLDSGVQREERRGPTI